MILSECLRYAREALRAAGIESPEADARLLLAAATGFSGADMILKAGEAVDAPARATFDIYIKRRLAREPVSRILGRREFWGLPFMVTPATLDPRPDSETLIDETLKELSSRSGDHLRIADFGTGTGCLLLALLNEMPQATGLGIDNSAAAVEVAEGNARVLGLASRASFAVQDWRTMAAQNFDWIVSNPPYIPETEERNLEPEVTLHDPHSALFAGRDGLDCYRDLARILPGFLADGGGACLEFGFNQSEQVIDIFKNSWLDTLRVARDLGGRERCIIVKKNLPK